MKEIISFLGGERQVGTTMIAASFSEYLAGKGERVLLVLGSGNCDDGLIPKEGHSIDELKAALRSGRVEKEEVMQILEKRKNLWILPGVKDCLTAKYFPENTWELLLNLLDDDFDYIVIDGGANVQIGLFVSALNVSSKRFFVITQQPKILRRYLQYEKQILQPLHKGGVLIVNKYLKDPAFLLKRDLLGLTGQQELFPIPYVEYGLQAEMEEKTLLSSRPFEKAVEKLVDSVSPKERKSGKWKKRFL